VVTIEVTQPSHKPQKTSSYACHICGLNGHKMTDCPKFVDWNAENVSWDIYGNKIVQLLVDTQTVIANVNVVDVNVTTKNKVTK
jgi:hypothetical protein